MARLPFPKTLSAFQSWFASDDACVQYLADSRWPDGYACPRCGHPEAYELTSRPVYKCKKCRYQVSVTAGTVLHGTRLSLRDWFSAAYLVATHTPGIFAVQLQRQLGLTRATKQRGVSCRNCDEPWFALSATASRVRSRSTKRTLVALRRAGELDDCVTAQRQSSSEPSRCAVTAPVESGSASSTICPSASLVGFLEQSVAPGSVVHTDGWGGYRPLANKGYEHRRQTQGSGKNAAKHFPRVHRVFSNLKTWLAGTHHGVGEQHLQHYLNEYVFRFNRRRAPMAAFQLLLGFASQHEPTTYNMLYDGESTG